MKEERQNSGVSIRKRQRLWGLYLAFALNFAGGKATLLRLETLFLERAGRCDGRVSSCRATIVIAISIIKTHPK
jgi:hypothetical protein